jgi:thiamine pyrophosphate-dependent acetolactate synthase large subunit-like protein
MEDIETPEGVSGNAEPAWGSDTMALAVRNTGVRYVALNPGASFRGFHDSLVNFLGNRDPQMILCLHEEHAVAIAHGFAKVAGEPMAVVLHSNVGLMHGTMGIFNAFCDRVPVLVLGATGPVDAAKRRPWIDWIHTAQDQGALVRNFIKWDDQPASVKASVESIYRANQIARTAPRGPVYVCLDAELQEERLDAPIVPPNAKRFGAAAPAQPADDAIRTAAALLDGARRPAIFSGRMARTQEAWEARVRLAEKLGAVVFTDFKAGATFPTAHPQHGGAIQFLSDAQKELVRACDVILSLDWIDLAGTLGQVWPEGDPGPNVIHASVDQYVHNGWSMDHQGLPPVDILLASEPDVAVPLIHEALAKARPPEATPPAPAPAPLEQDGKLTLDHIVEALKDAAGDDPVSLVRLPGGWPGNRWVFSGPMDYLGTDGGGGIGSGPGMAIGSALALKDSGRLAVAIIGDGDYLMGVNAFWTAAHYGIPLLTIVANNQSYYNDEMHQDRVARMRARNPENRWIGQKIVDPAADLAKLAEGQGVAGIGPVESLGHLQSAMMEGISVLRSGGACVIDVRVGPRGATAASMIGRR